MANVWTDLPAGEQSGMELEFRLQEAYRALNGSVGWGRPIIATQYDGTDPNLHVQALETGQSLFALLETHDSAVKYQGDNDGHAFEGPFAFTGDGTITGNVLINGTLHGTGAVDFDSTVNVDGAVTLGTTLHGIGAVDFDNTVNMDGAVTANANVTLGDAAADALLVKATSTFNEDATFVKNVTVQGNTILGDAAGDTITATGTMTVAEDLTLTKGLIVDTTTLVVDETNNNIGVGKVPVSTDPTVVVVGGVASTGGSAGTTSAAQLAWFFNVAGSNGVIRCNNPGAATYNALVIDGLSVSLRASNTNKLVADSAGIGVFGHATAGQQTAPTAVSSSGVDATYGNTERDLLIDLATQVNQLRTIVMAHGWAA